MTYIRAWMSSKFGQIRSGTTELAALEHLKKSKFPLFLVSQLWLYMYLGNSRVSIYRTIGLPVKWYSLHVIISHWPGCLPCQYMSRFLRKLVFRVVKRQTQTGLRGALLAQLVECQIYRNISGSKSAGAWWCVLEQDPSFSLHCTGSIQENIAPGKNVDWDVWPQKMARDSGFLMTPLIW